MSAKRGLTYLWLAGILITSKALVSTLKTGSVALLFNVHNVGIFF